MNIFDYLFCCRYTYEIKKKRESPFFNSVIYISMLIVALTCAAWTSVIYLLWREHPDHVYPVPIIIFIILYMRYKKKKEIILKKNRTAKTNPKHPLLLYYVSFILSTVLGIGAGVLARRFLEARYSQGALLDWITHTILNN